MFKCLKCLNEHFPEHPVVSFEGTVQATVFTEGPHTRGEIGKMPETEGQGFVSQFAGHCTSEAAQYNMITYL